MNRMRSQTWFETPELYGWLRKAALRSQGYTQEAYEGRPIIGICNSWSDLTHCNNNLRQLAESVKRGVLQAGGLPLEFPVMSLGEYNMRPSTMLYRNLMSMDVEESITANPLDGVVLLAGCDKTTPAMLMGAASANIPAIILTSGPQLKGNWQGRELGTCTDCRHYEQELRAGRITDEEWMELQNNIIRSPGHCGVMGTASTMAAVAEGLGIALPGNTDIPAADSRRKQLAEEVGRTSVWTAENGLRPSDLITSKSLDNAIRIVHALGGSTNALIHIPAIAGRLGIEIPLEHFDQLSKTTPWLLDLKPSGRFLMEDFFYAGGLSALLSELSPVLNMETITVSGQTLGDRISGIKKITNNVIKPLTNPLGQDGGLAVLKGSLAPGGAVIKTSAASANLMNHRGKAVVFQNHDDLLERIDSQELNVNREDILVMRGSGPVGAPGMPEWGFLPLPKKLLQKGVNDMVRISDARMSGTAFGTVVVHVVPESAMLGPLAAVEDGDIIELDVSRRILNLLVDGEAIKRRLGKIERPDEVYSRGYGRLYSRHVLQADTGCDFDFLRASSIGNPKT